MDAEIGTTNPARPRWTRWLGAFFAAWLLSPIFAPLLWQGFAAEGPSIIGIGLLFAYLIGIPLGGVGMIILFLITLIAFRFLARWPLWVWVFLGGAIGFAILASFSLVPKQHDYTVKPPSQLWQLAGVLPGAFAALIFRSILLGGQRSRSCGEAEKDEISGFVKLSPWQGRRKI